MIKRRRKSGAFVALIIGAIVIVTFGSTSIYQNVAVHNEFNGLFTAVKDVDADAIRAYYPKGEVSQPYMDYLMKFNLQGWEYTKVHAQPWPLETFSRYNTVEVNLYYKIPDIALSGKYEEITRPDYGPCIKVATKLQFVIENGDWFIVPPKLSDSENWLVPYTDMNAKPKVNPNAAKPIANPIALPRKGM